MQPPLQFQLISAITTKPVSLVEVAISCLQIPIISKSVGVKYVDSNYRTCVKNGD
jgi:hypothetical protein